MPTIRPRKGGLTAVATLRYARVTSQPRKEKDLPVSVRNASVAAAVAKVYGRTAVLSANVAVTVNAAPSAALMSKRRARVALHPHGLYVEREECRPKVGCVHALTIGVIAGNHNPQTGVIRPWREGCSVPNPQSTWLHRRR